MPINHRILREDRRFDFEKSEQVKELAQPPQDIGAESQVLPGCGRQEVVSCRHGNRNAEYTDRD